MRFSISVLLLLGQVAVSALAAAPEKVAKQPKTHFYRERKNAVKPSPKAAGDPVVVNAASYEVGISPGGLATVVGTDLSSVTGVVLAGTDPLPNKLGGVTVLVNGVFAPLFSVAYANGQDIISFQVPYDTPTGSGAGLVDVYNGDAHVASIQTDSFTEDPGIFVYNGSYAVAVDAVDGSLIGPSNPANPGDVLTLYTTGLGPLSLALVDGYGAPYNPLAYTQDAFRILVAGESCTLYFSGLAPGFVGLYQVNLRLPTDLPAGALDIQITSAFADSRVATLPVQ